MRPKVTVYITCNNYGKYVIEAVESVFNQIFTDLQRNNILEFLYEK